MTVRINRIDFSKAFDKKLRKAPLKIKQAFRKRLALFITNRFHSLLNNHPLSGKYLGHRSINVTGDWRAIYSERKDAKDELIVVFETLGTHSELYG